MIVDEPVHCHLCRCRASDGYNTEYREGVPYKMFRHETVPTVADCDCRCHEAWRMVHRKAAS